jgi:hypothetical protein
LVTIFYTHVGGHNSFSRNIQGDRKPLCSFLTVSPLGETGHLRKTPCKNIPQTNEHLHTAALTYTRKKIQTLYGNEACQTSTHVAPMRCKCRQHLEILTTKPLSAFQTEYRTLIYLSI